MDVHQLTEALNDYLQLSSPGYAVMIDGVWGSGKTYWIEDFFKTEKIPSIKISLYGLSTKDEITDRLFSSLSSIEDLDDDSIKKAGTFIGGITNLLSESDNGSSIGTITTSIASTIKNRMLDGLSKDTILIFDDLERSELEQHQVLSVINKFIEHQGMKAIIIADETKINDSKYKEQKEKVVLHTYKIELQAAEITEIIFGGIQVPKFIKSRSESEFTRVLELINAKNLRTLFHAAKSYAGVLKNLELKSHDFKNELFLTDFIFPCIAFSVGFKEIGLESSKLELFADEPLNRGVIYHLNKDSKDAGAQNVKTLEDTFYEDVYSKDRYERKFNSIFRLVCLGHYDHDSLSEEIKQLKPSIMTPREKLLWGEVMSDREFEDCVRDELTKMEQNTTSYSSANEMLSLLSFLHTIVKNDGYRITLDEIEQLIDNTADFVLENKTYGSSQVREQFNGGDEFLISLAKRVDKALAQTKKVEGMKSRQDAFMTLLNVDDTEISTTEQTNIIDSSLSQIFDLDFIDAIMTLLKDGENYCINNFNILLKNRYSSSNIFDYLFDEIEAFKKLEREINKLYPSLPPSFKKFKLNQTKTILSGIHEKIDSWKNKRDDTL